MMLGATEWAETHADELSKKGRYINSDGKRTWLSKREGSHSLQHRVNAVAADVSDPETGVPAGTRLRARLRSPATAHGRMKSRASAQDRLGYARDLQIERSAKVRIIPVSFSIWDWPAPMSVRGEGQAAASTIPPTHL